jgi:hypothetical protein
MATHQNRAAGSVDGIVHAQCRDNARDNKQRATKSSGSGKGFVTAVLDAAAHLGR